ncbi:MAG: ribose-phosphate diphosphokinase [Actinomycetota bacterium]
MSSFTLFPGSASQELAEAVAARLGESLGVCRTERFPDGETHVELLEPVRRKEVFLVQSTGPPVNERLIELLAWVDACRRAAAGPITAVVPYFGYSRSDKRHGRREPIGASMAATCLQALGIAHLVAVDLHATQIEGFFQVPVDNLTAVPTLCTALEGRLPEGSLVVAPDEGAVKLATRYAHRLRTRVAVVHKERESGTETHVTHVVGDVRDRPCLIVDDLISTGGTIRQCVEALLQAGARPEMLVVATHGLFTGAAREKLTHPAIQEISVTDSVASTAADWDTLRVVSLAPLLAAAIQRFAGNGSISDLF